jgi:serine protease Do
VGFQLNAADGLLISEVEKGSAAERAQLTAGVVLTGIDGVGVGEQVNLTNLLGNKRSGEVVQLSLLVPRRAAGGGGSLVPARLNVPVR